MENDDLNIIFNTLKEDFDFETPNVGHETRFLGKLQNQKTNAFNKKPLRSLIWKPLLAIAASILLLVSVFTITQQNNTINDLASVSPKMEETQNFFTTAIANELNVINNRRTPQTEKLINDALQQLNTLEKKYEILKIDLTESGNDKRVIFAMISNFQNRIDVLQRTINQIEQLKQDNNENATNAI